MASTDKSGAFLGQKTYTANYDAEVTLIPPFSAEAGIGVIGDEKNLIAATIKNDLFTVRKIEKDEETIVFEKKIPFNDEVYLRLKVTDVKDLTFEYSDDCRKYIALGNKSIDAFYLPPWDRAVRVGLISKGSPNLQSFFDNFVLRNNK
jgi:hypothetical protein